MGPCAPAGAHPGDAPKTGLDQVDRRQMIPADAGRGLRLAVITQQLLRRRRGHDAPRGQRVLRLARPHRDELAARVDVAVIDLQQRQRNPRPGDRRPTPGARPGGRGRPPAGAAPRPPTPASDDDRSRRASASAAKSPASCAGSAASRGCAGTSVAAAGRRRGGRRHARRRRRQRPVRPRAADQRAHDRHHQQRRAAPHHAGPMRPIRPTSERPPFAVCIHLPRMRDRHRRQRHPDPPRRIVLHQPKGPQTAGPSGGTDPGSLNRAHHDRPGTVVRYSTSGLSTTLLFALNDDALRRTGPLGVSIKIPTCVTSRPPSTAYAPT